jgi:hypothetical protein
LNFLIILYFLIPKFDLVNFNGIVTGVRLQDFIALILLCRLFAKPNFFNFGFLTFFYITINIILSYFSDNLLLTFIGWIRIFEYYVIGYALYRYFDFKNFKKLIYLELILIVSQYLLILPNFDPGRGIILSSQYSGTFGTPAELSYLLGLLCFFYLEKLSLYSTLIFTPIIISNGVQASVLLPLKIIFKKILDKIHARNVIKFILIIISASLLLSIYYKEINSIANMFRVISDFDFSSFTSKFFSDNDLTFGSELLPQTLNVRLIKWGAAIHLFSISNFLQILFGSGLYLTQGALDSGIIRFVYELGLVPLFFFFSKLYKKNLSALLIIVFANIFFDAWISSATAPIIIAIYLKSIYE